MPSTIVFLSMFYVLATPGVDSRYGIFSSCRTLTSYAYMCYIADSIWNTPVPDPGTCVLVGFLSVPGLSRLGYTSESAG